MARHLLLQIKKDFLKNSKRIATRTNRAGIVNFLPNSIICKSASGSELHPKRHTAEFKQAFVETIIRISPGLQGGKRIYDKI